MMDRIRNTRRKITGHIRRGLHRKRRSALEGAFQLQPTNGLSSGVAGTSSENASGGPLAAPSPPVRRNAPVRNPSDGLVLAPGDATTRSTSLHSISPHEKTGIETHPPNQCDRTLISENRAHLSEADTSQSSSQTTRHNCWDIAADLLKESEPTLYEKLTGNVKTEILDAKWKPELLLESMRKQEKRHEELDSKLKRAIGHTIRGLLIFKDIAAAAASLDPHKIAPVAVRGVFIILEVILFP